MKPWTTADIPSQKDRLAVVNSGIGWHTALELARAGGTVILTARTEARGRDAVDRIRRLSPERGSVTRSGWHAEPMPEPIPTSPCHRRAAAHRAALRGSARMHPSCAETGSQNRFPPLPRAGRSGIVSPQA